MGTNHEPKDLLRSSRKALGLTQSRLADALRVKRGLVSHWESGHVAVSAAVLAGVWHAAQIIGEPVDPDDVRAQFRRDRLAWRTLVDAGDAHRARRPFVLREQREKRAADQLDIFEALHGPTERREQLQVVYPGDERVRILPEGAGQ